MKIFAAVDDLIKTSTQYVATIANGNPTSEDSNRVLRDARTLVGVLLPALNIISCSCHDSDILSGPILSCILGGVHERFEQDESIAGDQVSSTQRFTTGVDVAVSSKEIQGM